MWAVCIPGESWPGAYFVHGVDDSLMGRPATSCPVCGQPSHGSRIGFTRSNVIAAVMVYKDRRPIVLEADASNGIPRDGPFFLALKEAVTDPMLLAYLYFGSDEDGVATHLDTLHTGQIY